MTALQTQAIANPITVRIIVEITTEPLPHDNVVEIDTTDPSLDEAQLKSLNTHFQSLVHDVCLVRDANRLARAYTAGPEMIRAAMEKKLKRYLPVLDIKV